MQDDSCRVAVFRTFHKTSSAGVIVSSVFQEDCFCIFIFVNVHCSGAYVEFAKRYGALIFAVEHRFYGASINANGLLLENLKHLSSQQA